MWDGFPSCNWRERALHTSLHRDILTHSEGSIPYHVANKVCEMCISADIFHCLAKWGVPREIRISDELTPEGYAELPLRYLEARSTTQPLHCCRGHNPDPYRAPDCQFSLCEPWDPCLVDSVDCVILVPFSDFYNPSSPSSARFPKFRGCGSLHLLLSVVRWSISGDDYARLCLQM